MAGDTEAVDLLLRFDDPDVAVEVFSRWRQGHGQVLLIVDQFEELFTQNASEVQARFAELLGRLALEADVHVLLSMRDDFLLPLPPVPGASHRCCDGADHARPTSWAGPPPRPGPAGHEVRLPVRRRRAGGRDARRGGGRAGRAAAAGLRRGQAVGEERPRRTVCSPARRTTTSAGSAARWHGTPRRPSIASASERMPIVRELFRNLVTADGTRAVREWDELLSVFDEAHATAGRGGPSRADRCSAADVLRDSRGGRRAHPPGRDHPRVAARQLAAPRPLADPGRGRRPAARRAPPGGEDLG